MKKRRRAMKSVHKGILAASILVSVILLPGREANAAYLWKADVIASAMNDSNKLILGQAENATDGFESGYDVRATLSGNFQAYFYHPEWGMDTAYFWNDVRDAALPKEWVFYVNSSYINKETVIRWNFKNVPDSLKLHFVDTDSDVVVDMKENNSYSYLSTSVSARQFIVRATVEPAP